MFIRLEYRTNNVSIDKCIFFKNSETQDVRVLDNVQIKNVIIKFNFTVEINKRMIQDLLEHWIDKSDFYQDSFSQVTSPCHQVFYNANPLIYSGEVRNIEKLIKFGFREVLNKHDDELCHYHLHEIGVNVKLQEKEDNIEVKYKHSKREQMIVLNFHLKRSLKQLDIDLTLLDIKKNLEEFYGACRTIKNAEKVNIFNYPEYGYRINLKSQGVYEEFMRTIARGIMHSEARGSLTDGEQYALALLYRYSQGGIGENLDKAAALFYQVAKQYEDALRALENLAHNGCAAAQCCLKLHTDEQQLVIAEEKICAAELEAQQKPTEPEAKLKVGLKTEQTTLVMPAVDDQRISDHGKPKDDGLENHYTQMVVKKIAKDAQQPILSVLSDQSIQAISILSPVEISLKFRRDSADQRVAADLAYTALVKRAILLNVHLEQSTNGNTALHWALMRNQVSKAIVLLREIESLGEKAIQALEIQNHDGKAVLVISNELGSTLPDEFWKLIQNILSNQFQNFHATLPEGTVDTQSISQVNTNLNSVILPQETVKSNSNLLRFTTSKRQICIQTSTLVDSQELMQFLRLVAEGEQDQAEAMLQKNRDLVLFPGDVTDLSKRTFEQITGFQYAVWALDWHMWKMLRRYLSDDEAGIQLRAVGIWVNRHGAHAGIPGGPLEQLIKAYEKYNSNIKRWVKNVSELSEIQWCKRIGGAQLLLPAHVINEYCRPDRSFNLTPLFLEEILPRTRKINWGVGVDFESDNLVFSDPYQEIGLAHADSSLRSKLGEGTEWFTALDKKGGKLGEKFAICRHQSQVVCMSGMGCTISIGCMSGRRKIHVNHDNVLCDHKAVIALTKVRTQQREQLISELRVTKRRQRVGN